MSEDGVEVKASEVDTSRDAQVIDGARREGKNVRVIKVVDKINKPEGVGGKYLTEGAYGVIYKDEERGIITKQLKDLNPDVYGQEVVDASKEDFLDEVKFYAKFGGQLDIPKLEGVLVDEENKVRAYEQEFKPGIGFRKWLDSGEKMTAQEVEALEERLEQIHRLTGVPHRDLVLNDYEVGQQVPRFNGENIRVEVRKNPDGSTSRNFHFIDFYPGRHGESSRMPSSTSEEKELFHKLMLYAQGLM